MKKQSDLGVILIGIFKLLKGVGLLILAFGLLRLVHRDVGAVVSHWAEVLRVDPDNEYLHRALARVFRVTPKQLKELSAGTFLYAGLFFTEGFGLLRRRHWAEYLTVVSTAVFIPLEVYEIWRRLTWTRASVLVINLLIVWYLAMRIAKRRF